jgi:hypothetical protein
VDLRIFIQAKKVIFILEFATKMDNDYLSLGDFVGDKTSVIFLLFFGLNSR